MTSGSLPWVRAWFGDHIRRGAQVTVNGKRARIVSARDGLLNVRTWSGERLSVRPDLAFPLTVTGAAS